MPNYFTSQLAAESGLNPKSVSYTCAPLINRLLHMSVARMCVHKCADNQHNHSHMHMCSLCILRVICVFKFDFQFKFYFWSINFVSHLISFMIV